MSSPTFNIGKDPIPRVTKNCILNSPAFNIGMDTELGIPIPTKVYIYIEQYIEPSCRQYRDGCIPRVTNKVTLSMSAFKIGMDTYLGLPTMVY